MAKSLDSTIAFTGGEFSPKNDARIDNPKYKSALRKCLNMIPLSQGPITRRPGTQYMGKANLSGAFATRLLKFVFSPDTTFVLEVGFGYIRFYSNGQQVLVTNPPIWTASTYYARDVFVKSSINGLVYFCLVTIPNSSTDPSLDATHWVQQNILQVSTQYNAVITTTPWATDIFGLQIAQINDVVYFVHPKYPPFKLTRFTDTVWTMQQVAFDKPVGLDENTSNTVLTPSAVNGVITVTATAPAWATATYYISGNSVSSGGNLYICNITHTSSGTFATELANGYWILQTVFQTGTEFSTWLFRTLRPASSVSLVISANATSSVLPVKGAWRLETTETWSADIALQRSYDNGLSWTTILTLSYRGDSSPDRIDTGSEDVDTQFRIVITNWTTVTSTISPRVILTNEDAYITGTFQIQPGITAYSAPALVIDQLNSTAGSTHWSEGAWSNLRGYPTAITTFQQRLVYAGTAYQPQRMWFSQTEDLDNFDLGDQSLATDAVVVDLAAVGRGPIIWLIAQVDLFVGLSGAEWVVNAGTSSTGTSAGNAITPTAINAVEHSNWGSAANVQPHIVGDAVVYCQRQTTNIRQMLFSIYTQKYMSQEITELADHLFVPGVVQMDYQPQYRGQGVLWVVNQQGRLLSLSYDLEREVFGWARHNTGYGTTDNVGNALANDKGFESVCVIDGKGVVDDEVWVVANRTINSVATRFIERINPANWETVFTTAPNPPAPVLSSAFYVDCGVTLSSGSSTGVFTAGVAHLPNRWVVGLARGIPFGPVLADGSGTFTVPGYPISGQLSPGLTQVGIQVPYSFQTMKLDIDPRVGNTQGLYKQLSDVFIRVMNSSGGTISNGTTGTNAQQPVPINYQSVLTASTLQFVTDPIDIRVQPQLMPAPGVDPVFVIQGADASPLTVVSMSVKYDIESTP